MSGQNPRQIAAEILLQRRPGGDFTEGLLERALAQAGLSTVDRALCQELVYGVVRWQAALDWLIGRKTDGREQKPGLQNLLRLGLYQIFWLDRIPDHAAVHQTVELARQNGFDSQTGFVNAVLRGYLREARRHEATAGRIENEAARAGLVASRMARHALAETLGRGKDGATFGMEQHAAENFARVNTLKWGRAAVPAAQIKREQCRRRRARSYAVPPLDKFAAALLCSLACGRRRIRSCPARAA